MLIKIIFYFRALRRAHTDTGNEKVKTKEIKNIIFVFFDISLSYFWDETFLRTNNIDEYFCIIWKYDNSCISTCLKLLQTIFFKHHTISYFTFYFYFYFSLFFQSQLLSKSVLEISASLLPFDFTDFGNSKSVILSDVTNDGMSKSLKRQKTSSPKKVQKLLFYCKKLFLLCVFFKVLSKIKIFLWYGIQH